MTALRSIAVALLALPLVASAQARAPRSRAAADANRAAIIASLPKGSELTSGGERYRLLGGVRALRRAAHETEAQTLARAGASEADVVDRKGTGFVVVRVAAPPAATIPGAGYLAAVNARTGNVAVVTGILEVRLRKGADPAALAGAHRLVVVSSAPRLSMTFLRVRAGQDLQAAAAGLHDDPRVEEVEIEVLEHVNAPR